VSIQRFALSALLVAGSAGLSACERGAPAPRDLPRPENANMNIYSLTTNDLDGKATSLDRYGGKVTLLVNVASYCGKTPQYAGLERLHQKYEQKGFSVLAFPSNDFGRQEPGTPEEIREFCSKNYQVTFPLFQKVQTKPGAGQSPVYGALERASGKLPSWNFGKYLIGRDGKVIRFFPPNVEPEAPELVSAIETALAGPHAKAN
jgi:glutathione peroxidase